MVYIGDYVKILSSGDMGVVVNMNYVNGYVVSVFVKHPRTYTTDVRVQHIEIVSATEYEKYLNNKPTGNYVIDHAKNDGRSIEQQIFDSYYEGDIDAWMNPNLWEDNEKVFKGHNNSWNLKEKDFEQYDDITFLSAEEKEDLNKMYIELALLTGDKEWFDKLTNKK